MTSVTELRVALTVQDFDQTLAFYRDALGLDQVANWSSASGRGIVLDAPDDARTARRGTGRGGRRVKGFAIDLMPELVRTGRAWEVERSRPGGTVAVSDRSQPAYQKVLERKPGGGVGSGRRCS